MNVAIEIDDRITKCRKLLDSDPNSQIFAALAEAYRKKGRLDDAFRVCQSGLKIHPSYGSAHLVMAKVNLDKGMYDWAETEIMKASELDGANRATELLLAEVYIYRSEFSKAIRLLKTLRQADPNSEQIRKLLEIAEQIPAERAAIKVVVAPSLESEVTEISPRSGDSNAGGDSDAAKSDSKAKVLSVEEVLEQAIAVDSLCGAMLVNAEGMVVKSEWTDLLDVDTCGAITAEVGLYLKAELGRAGFGASRTLLIEAASRVFFIIFGTNGQFVFVGDSKVNLGGFRMKVPNLIERYEWET